MEVLIVLIAVQTVSLLQSKPHIAATAHAKADTRIARIALLIAVSMDGILPALGA
jgi:hypothetical protein